MPYVAEFDCDCQMQIHRVTDADEIVRGTK